MERERERQGKGVMKRREMTDDWLGRLWVCAWMCLAQTVEGPRKNSSATHTHTMAQVESECVTFSNQQPSIDCVFPFEKRWCSCVCVCVSVCV